MLGVRSKRPLNPTFHLGYTERRMVAERTLDIGPILRSRAASHRRLCRPRRSSPDLGPDTQASR